MADQSMLPRIRVPSLLEPPRLANTQHLPLSYFLLDFLQQQGPQRAQKPRLMSIPQHFLTPDTISQDTNYYRTIYSISKQIQAADRRSSFYGRALHALSANDSREAARLLVKRRGRIDQEQILLQDQMLRESKQDRGFFAIDARHSAVYQLYTLDFPLGTVCPCPGCFQAYTDEQQRLKHIARHTGAKQCFRCCACATELFNYAQEPSQTLSERLDGCYFDSLLELFIHLQRHKFIVRGYVEGYYLCPQCLFANSSEYSVLEHCKAHADGNDYEQFRKNLIFGKL